MITIPLKHIEIDVPDCPPVPAAVSGGVLGIPSWVVGWGIALLALFLIGAGFLIAFIYEKRSDRKTAEARDRSDALKELSKHWTTCPTCKADFKPSLRDERDLVGFGGP